MYHRFMDAVPPNLTVFILAGGRSTRMGADKPFVLLDGRSLLTRALELGRALTPDVRVAGDSSKFAQFAPVVEDIFRGCGPLSAIHAALRISTSELNLMLAVDLPFVPLAFLQLLVARARNFPDATVILARSAGRLHPLCALYRRGVADVAENALRAGQYKINLLFDELHTHVIEQQQLEAHGFSEQIFRNLNTPQELEEATNNSDTLEARS